MVKNIDKKSNLLAVTGVLYDQGALIESNVELLAKKIIDVLQPDLFSEMREALEGLVTQSRLDDIVRPHERNDQQMEASAKVWEKVHSVLAKTKKEVSKT